jgi:hypothetical protein
VLPLEEDELARLQPIELVQTVEPPLVEREHAFELVETSRGGVDVVLEGANLRGDDGDLRGEHALLRPRGFDPGLKRPDLLVQRGLPLRDAVMGEGGCDGKQEAGQQEAGGEAKAHPSEVSPRGRPSLPGRPRPV